jgi:hypothetical protein
MSQPGFAGNRYIVDINGSAGAFVQILAKSPVRRVTIEESPITSAGVNNPLQGLIDYQIPNDNTPNGFTTVFRAVGGNTEAAEGQVEVAKIMLGNPIAQHAEGGEIIGNGPNVIVGMIGGTPATQLANVRSGTATATSVMVTEYN